MNSLFDRILYEAPHRVEKLIGEIVEIDKSRELFLAKELTKLHQRYIRDSAENILEMFRDSKIDSRGEWVVIIEANHTIQRYLIADDIIKMDIPPKVKSKLLSKITDQSIKSGI